MGSPARGERNEKAARVVVRGRGGEEEQGLAASDRAGEGGVGGGEGGADREGRRRKRLGRGPPRSASPPPPRRGDEIDPRGGDNDDDGGPSGRGGGGLAGAAAGWIRRLAGAFKRGEGEPVASWLRRCYREATDGADESAAARGLAAALSVALLAAVLSRRRRARRRRLLLPSAEPSYLSAADAPLSLLYQSADRGRVGAARLGGPAPGAADGTVVYYRLKHGDVGRSPSNESSSSSSAADAGGGWKKSTLPGSVARGLVETLSRRCDDVAVLPGPAPSRLSGAAAPVLVSAIPFVYLLLLYRVLKETASGLSSGERREENLRMLEDRRSTRVTFADVAGMPQVVAEIGEVVRYLSDPQSYRAVGARPPRAILLHGPPGSGKTLLAQAVAGQAGVPFFACSASEFVEVYVGRGAARVRSLFSQARLAAARGAIGPGGEDPPTPPREGEGPPHPTWSSILQSVLLPWLPSLAAPPSAAQPAPPASTDQGPAGPLPGRPAAASILFIDELDALGKSRAAAGSNDEREQTLNQLLTELDGFDRAALDTEGGGEAGAVIVIAATNRVDVLDPAILRRFDRQVHVGYPATPRDRREILLVHAKRVSCGVDVDWDRVAGDARTLGCSGADLANLVNEAALLAVREGSPVVQQEQLDHAARRIQQMKWRQDRADGPFLNLNGAGIR